MSDSNASSSTTSNARASMVAAHELPSILSAMVQPEYLARLGGWPRRYGGGADTVRHIYSLCVYVGVGVGVGLGVGVRVRSKIR